MASRVAIVTDSTADLPASMVKDAGIRVVPLNVHFGDEVFLDGVTIESDEFYRRLQSGGAFPKTSQPSAGTFVEAYRELMGEGAEAIVSIHLSSKVSGTYNSAVQAKAELGSGAQIEVLDTLQASMGLGLIVAEAARGAAAGASAAEIAAAARRTSAEARFFGLVDTLEYLHKGGRIGRAQMLLGSLLKIHPILTIHDGVAHALDRARTRSRGFERICAIALAESPVRALSVLYSTERADADRLADALGSIAPAAGIATARFGPVLGTYLGPGAIGVALLRGVPR